MVVIVAGLHATTFALPWLAGISPPFSLSLGILVAAHWIYATRRALLATPRSVMGIELGPGSACRLRRRNGTVIEGRVTESTIVTGSLVVMSVKSQRGWTLARVPVMPGTVEAETFRALRVRLRWDREPAMGKGATFG
jgi:toxin CptA